MTIDRASIRTAIIALVLFTLFGCLLVSVLYPTLRSAGAGLVWGALLVAWGAVGGGALLLRTDNRARAAGLLLAFVAIPILAGFYWFLLQLIAATQTIPR